MVLFCKNLEESWSDFKSNFKVIPAAGGLVLNDENEFLFVFRGCKWDLPKGRVEKGEKIKETAVREVQEECGISNVIVHEFLITTHHIFYYNEKIKLTMLSENFKVSINEELISKIKDKNLHFKLS